jgi:hypothetical protein
MPSISEIIPLRILTDHEKRILQHRWPMDADSMAAFSFKDFQTWLYGLDPRDAVILSGDPAFDKFFRGYFAKNKWKFIWRLFWE